MQEDDKEEWFKYGVALMEKDEQEPFEIDQPGQNAFQKIVAQFSKEKPTNIELKSLFYCVVLNTITLGRGVLTPKEMEDETISLRDMENEFYLMWCGVDMKSRSKTAKYHESLPKTVVTRYELVAKKMDTYLKLVPDMYFRDRPRARLAVPPIDKLYCASLK